MVAIVNVYEVMSGNEDCTRYRSCGLFFEKHEAEKMVVKIGGDPWARIETRVAFKSDVTGKVFVARGDAETCWASERELVRQQAIAKLTKDERESAGAVMSQKLSGAVGRAYHEQKLADERIRADKANEHAMRAEAAVAQIRAALQQVRDRFSATCEEATRWNWEHGRNNPEWRWTRDSSFGVQVEAALASNVGYGYVSLDEIAKVEPPKSAVMAPMMSGAGLETTKGPPLLGTPAHVQYMRGWRECLEAIASLKKG